jgi:hypothetical protein
MPVLYASFSGQTNTPSEGQQHIDGKPQQSSQNDQQQDEEARIAASIRAQEVVGLGGVDLGKTKHKPKLQQANIVPAVALTILCVAIFVVLVVAVFVWRPFGLPKRLSDWHASARPSLLGDSDHQTQKVGPKVKTTTSDGKPKQAIKTKKPNKNKK